VNNNITDHYSQIIKIKINNKKHELLEKKKYIRIYNKKAVENLKKKILIKEYKKL